jgi:hypothetical protein
MKYSVAGHGITWDDQFYSAARWEVQEQARELARQYNLPQLVYAYDSNGQRHLVTGFDSTGQEPARKEPK